MTQPATHATKRSNSWPARSAACYGLFAAGLTLVGSHAYGALVNDLGIATPAMPRRTLM
jgi:hypothetical protein